MTFKKLVFTSSRERRFWGYSFAVLVAIYSTLGLASTLAGMLRDRGLLSDSIWLGIFLVGATIVANGLRMRPRKIEIAIWLGIIAAYLFILIRMALPEERSHLIEYGVLAIFIYEALKERKKNGGKIRFPPLVAIILASVCGLIDEGIQAVLPLRVFDPIDIAFNTLAATMAVVSSFVLSWIRTRITE